MINNPTQASKKRNTAGMEALLIPNRTIQIVQNEKHNRIEMLIMGAIDGPENYTQELQTLSSLSDQFDTLYITINSPGGAVSTLLQLYTAIKKFAFVITHATGMAGSAGFFLWCMGDIRVVSRLSELMFHRESYGMFGKSVDHEDMLNVTKRLGEGLTRELVTDILTEEEMELGKSREVYFLGNDMIDRGVAICEDEFLEKDRSQIESMKVVVINGESFVQPDPSSPWVMPSGQTPQNGEVPMMYHMASLVYLGSLAAVQHYDATGMYHQPSEGKGLTDLEPGDVEQMLTEQLEEMNGLSLAEGDEVVINNPNMKTYGMKGIITKFSSTKTAAGESYKCTIHLENDSVVTVKESNVARVS